MDREVGGRGRYSVPLFDYKTPNTNSNKSEDIFTFTNPLITRVVGAPQTTYQPVPYQWQENLREKIKCTAVWYWTDRQDTWLIQAVVSQALLSEQNEKRTYLSLVAWEGSRTRRSCSHSSCDRLDVSVSYFCHASPAAVACGSQNPVTAATSHSFSSASDEFAFNVVCFPSETCITDLLKMHQKSVQTIYRVVWEPCKVHEATDQTEDDQSSVTVAASCRERWKLCITR